MKRRDKTRQPQRTDPFRWLGAIHFNNRGPYSPLPLIRAVNGFQSMGKDRALAAMVEYVRSAKDPALDDVQSLFLVLLCLFDIPNPPGHMPEIPFGASQPPGPVDQRLVPRFPLVLLEDIPLLLYMGTEYAGETSSTKPFLTQLQKFGQIRSRPLHPSDNPFAVLDSLRASPQWLWGRAYRTETGKMHSMDSEEEEYGNQTMMRQLLRLIASVYPRSFLTVPLSLQSSRNPRITPREWRGYTLEWQVLNAYWDPSISDYKKRL